MEEAKRSNVAPPGGGGGSSDAGGLKAFQPSASVSVVAGNAASSPTLNHSISAITSVHRPKDITPSPTQQIRPKPSRKSLYTIDLIITLFVLLLSLCYTHSYIRIYTHTPSSTSDQADGSFSGMPLTSAVFCPYNKLF